MVLNTVSPGSRWDNCIWLIGLFFFGIHLRLLGRIIGRPRIIGIFLVLAGAMYMADTAAHFVLPDYENYASIFLALGNPKHGRRNGNRIPHHAIDGALIIVCESGLQLPEFEINQLPKID